MGLADLSNLKPQPIDSAQQVWKELTLRAFGDTLINLRTDRGLSVKEACQKVGIPQSRLSELERGVRIPTPGQITQLEKFFETDSDKLAELAKQFEENLV